MDGYGILKGTHYPPKKKSHTSPTKHKQHHCDLSRLEPFFPLISRLVEKAVGGEAPEHIGDFLVQTVGTETTVVGQPSAGSTKYCQYVLFGLIKSLYLGHL